MEHCYYLSDQPVICEDFLNYFHDLALISVASGRGHQITMGRKNNSSTGLHEVDSTGVDVQVSKQHAVKRFFDERGENKREERTGWKETGRRTSEGWEIPCYRYAGLGSMPEDETGREEGGRTGSNVILQEGVLLV